MTKKLQPGKKAPSFSLSDKNGQTYSLKDLISDCLVIFFYPKDDTPGCTIESKEFTRALKKFKKLGVAVVGISGGDDKSKAKFCKKHKIKTLMLSDSDFAVSKKYGSYGQKSFMGRKYNGIFRMTFIVGKTSKVLKVYDQVKPEGHAKEVLEFLESNS